MGNAGGPSLAGGLEPSYKLYQSAAQGKNPTRILKVMLSPDVHKVLGWGKTACVCVCVGGGAEQHVGGVVVK